MTFTWIPAILSKKGLMLLSTASATPSLFPNLFGSMDTLMFAGTGWGMVVVLSIWEYWTSPASEGTNQEKKAKKKLERSELFSKAITYTLMFASFIFLHSWAVHENKEYLSYVTDFLVIGLYLISVFGELIFIGNNIEEKYGKKPPFFNFIQKLNDLLQKKILEKVGSKVCSTDETDTDIE